MAGESWNVALPCAASDVDFTEARLGTAEGDRAVDTCLSCPVMARCLEYLRRTEVAGVAAGMDVAEREDWRERQGLERSPRALDVWETTPVVDLTPADISELPIQAPTGYRRFSGEFITFVLRLTDAGWTAAEIVEFVADERVRRQSVNYLRRTKGAGSKVTAFRKRQWGETMARSGRDASRRPLAGPVGDVASRKAAA